MVDIEFSESIYILSGPVGISLNILMSLGNICRSIGDSEDYILNKL